MSGEAIGIMDAAFFVGRGELLAWINDFLQLSLTKVEQCATGAVYTQVLDAIYPGTIAIGKIKWNAKHDYEFLENYKVLQQGFAKNSMKKYIDVDKLAKAKYQDNLEFLQWMKKYFDMNYNGEPYDAVGRRKGQDLFYILGGGKVGGQPGTNIKGVQKPKIGTTKPVGGVKPSAAATIKKKPTDDKTPTAAAKAVESADLKQLQGELSEAKLNMDTLEKERDFYFGKLRDIEMFLQANPNGSTPLTEQVLKILYASEEERVQIDDEGNLTIVPLNEDGVIDNDDQLMEEEKLE